MSSTTLDTMRPTRVRYSILAATTAASFILYLHRAFIAEILKYDDIRAELQLTPENVAATYASLNAPLEITFESVCLIEQVDHFCLDVAELLGHLACGWGCCVAHDVRPLGGCLSCCAGLLQRL